MSPRYTVRMTKRPTDSVSDDLVALLSRQQEPDEHDRGLILERLSWTVEQRLDANTAFLRFYIAARPTGPLVGDEPT
jgi:hypothetical protein